MSDYGVFNPFAFIKTQLYDKKNGVYLVKPAERQTNKKKERKKERIDIDLLIDRRLR